MATKQPTAKPLAYYLSRYTGTGGTQLLTGTGSAQTGQRIASVLVKSETATITNIVMWKDGVEYDAYDNGILGTEFEKDALISFDGVVTSVTFGSGEEIMAYKEDMAFIREHVDSSVTISN